MTSEPNPCAPSQTPVSQSASAEDEFYVVSRKKFWVLYLATMGTYGFYWFYRHWKQYKKFHALRIWPIPRVIFAIFFIHELFRDIDDSIRRKQLSTKRQASANANALVVFTLVLGMLNQKPPGAPLSDLFLIFVSLLLVVPTMGWLMWRAQKLANLACEDVAGKCNSNISVANIVWIMLGALLWGITAVAPFFARL